MDLVQRLKHLTKGMAVSKNIEDGLENGTLSDKEVDLVWNTLNIVSLISIKVHLEQSIPVFTEVLMDCMDNKEKYKSEILLLDTFLDILNNIKQHVDDSSAGNVNL